MTELGAGAQESEGIDHKSIVWLSFGVLVITAVLILAAYELLQFRRSTLQSAPGVAAAPQPVSEVSNIRTRLFREQGAGEALQEQERAALRSYGWVDEQHGIVRIPIDVAIELEAKEEQK